MNGPYAQSRNMKNVFLTVEPQAPIMKSFMAQLWAGAVDAEPDALGGPMQAPWTPSRPR